MKKKNFQKLFFLISVLVFILLVKYFYFDTEIGFETKILELNHSALPICVDVIIGILFIPIFIYLCLLDIYDRVNS